MFFSKPPNNDVEPVVVVAGRKLSVANEYKNLGIVIDSPIPLERQIKKVVNKVKYNLANFRLI